MQEYKEDGFLADLRDQIHLMNELLEGVETEQLQDPSIITRIDTIQDNLKKLKNQCERPSKFGIFSAMPMMW